MSEHETRILLIEDDEEDYLITRDHLEDIEAWDARLEWAPSFQEGLEKIQRREHDVYLVDYRLGPHDGLELIRAAIEQGCTAPLILLTGLHDHEIDLAAMEAGAADFLTKGRVDTDQLERSIRYARERAQARDLLAEANQSLHLKNQKLSELTETAHRFVDNVAHEFRTPLTVIREFSSIISEGLGGPVTDPQIEYLSYIDAATRDLAHMVDDFLDSSKLKVGSLRVDRRPHTVEALFESVEPTLRVRAREKRINVIQDIAPGLPEFSADLEKAGRVIVNLAVNAIKFSQPDSDVRLWAAPDGEGGVSIGITDNGPGLSAQDVTVIFERFKQVGDVQRASTKGFGLGLNIAKELIWLNLGTVAVTSELGEGSTFQFSLAPNDSGAIVGRYLDRLAELDEQPLVVAALRVTSPDPANDTENTRAQLASICYPMDLLLPALDGRAVIALGVTGKPERWIERLQQTLANRNAERQTAGDAPLDIEIIGRWDTPERRDDAVSAVLERIHGLSKCA